MRAERKDQLTGLLNRSLLNERLEHELLEARIPGRRLAVYMIDVDGLKRINDLLGWRAGDEVLVYVAQQLSQYMQTETPSGGTVARVGGDEFVVLLPYAGEQQEAERFAQELLGRVCAPVTIAGREVRMTISMGLSLYPENGQTGEALVSESELAMHVAKHEERGSWRSFSQEMRHDSMDRLEMEQELRHALQAQELELHYQPQVNCRTGQVSGVEMLLRWNSARFGSVPPNVFLPIAEQAGLLTEIGDWGLHQACLDGQQMQKALGRPLQVAVNLSPRQINQQRLLSVVKNALEQSGLSAQQLELEITEDVLMTSTMHVQENLRELRALGCSVALDDFGTGFCCFAYILDYKVDRIKIDRSFIARLNQDEHADAVVRAMIAMGRGLQIELVAEGVETHRQLAFLLRKHCDTIQGWLFAKAAPMAKFLQTTREAEERAREWVRLCGDAAKLSA